jgi:hypothetical protein
MIRIKRDSGYADRLRAYKVVLDGDVIAEIRNGQQLDLDVPPGRHRLQLKIDWCRSNCVDFEASGNPMGLNVVAICEVSRFYWHLYT